MLAVLLSTTALAAAAVSALDIPAVPTWPSGRCTDKSLTIPSWIISKYRVSNGTTAFRIDNRAADPNGLIADIECTPSGACQTSGNDELRGSISQGPDGPVITLSEVWVCADAGDKVVFTASGSTTITNCAGTDCVSPIPYLVYGGLSLPVPLTPAQPSPPPGYSAASCPDVGDNQWTVTGVSYQNYTKGQCKQWYIPDEICLNPPTSDYRFKSKGDYLNLTVTNNAIDYAVACSFAPTYEHYYLPSPLRCTGGDFNEIALDVSLTGTAPNFDLKIEQLWYCLENPSTNVNASVVLATGNTPIQLNCSSTTGITGTADDIITLCSDPAASHAVAAVQTAKQTLPAFSLVTAYPAQGGCTFDSVVNPTYYMRTLYFYTNEFSVDATDSVTLDRFSLTLTGPGFHDYSIYTGAALSGSGINTVYNCNYYNNGQPLENHWNCSYSFDPFQKVITLDKVWKCSEKDAAHPLYFEGSGSFDWKVDPYYDCSTVNSTLHCLWHDSLSQLQPGIPYDIPKVTASLIYVPPPHVGTVRTNGAWAQVD